MPPWFPGRNERERAVRSLRRQALKLLRRGSDQGLGVWALRCLAWPVVLPIKAWKTAKDSEQAGIYRRFFRGCGDLAGRNIRPGALEPLRDVRRKFERTAALYVSDRENQALLIDLVDGVESATIGDKIVFAEFCRRHDLPSIGLLAYGRGRTVEKMSADWPTGDLFAKTSHLWGGQGAEALCRDSLEDGWRDQAGRLIRRDGIADWAEQTYGDQAWLVQPMYVVDPTWGAWSPGPLGTVRIVTVIVTPGDGPEIIAASMRLPRANMVVDNFSAGAFSAEIDWKTGTLGPALARSGAARWHDVHPDTGGGITGAVVPRWAESCALAIRAHAAAPDLAAVGWDISCHAGEPILLEANPVFNLAPTVVLGETRWVEAMTNHLLSKNRLSASVKK